MQIENKKKRPVSRRTWSDFYVYVRKINWKEWFWSGQSASTEGRLLDAYLSEHQVAGHEGLYRIDFELVDKTKINTFVLQRLDYKPPTPTNSKGCAAQTIGELC